MKNKENSYLFLSAISAIILPFSFSKSNGNFTDFIASFNFFWIPIWLLILFLPFYGITEIVKRTDEIPIKFWIGLLLNMVNFMLILSYFSLEILPD